MCIVHCAVQDSLTLHSELYTPQTGLDKICNNIAELYLFIKRDLIVLG